MSDELQLLIMVITAIVSLVIVGLLLYVLALPWPGNLIQASILAMFLAAWWRNVLAGPGIYVGEAGILARLWLWGGQVVPWSDIHRVRLIDDPHWRRLRIVIVKRDGTFVRASWGMYPRRAQAIADELDRLAAQRNGRIPSD